MYRGSCLCGGVKYELRALGPVICCHCGQCRKAQGSAFATNSPVKTEDFKLTAGEALLKAYESSPGKQRVFCGNCGSPIYSRLLARPEVLRLRLGTLDTPIGARPSMHIYAGSKAEWYEILDDLPQHEALPG